MELVTPQWIKTDSIGNEISPGDLVSCDGTRGWRAEVGILLGWTENGYRVAPFCTNSKVEHNRIIKSNLISPNVVFLVKRKNSTILE
ncbi:hypothetical protein CkP1_0153 [Citrobacter phage CkP1]|nr:hypothetical protein CkP1_0153 [Citrobacter phage CkP1]